ncbi:MAG: precorrin-6A reductase [Fusobacterium sp.]|uniref:precorrin-6A reductase n=1 Tax=Fusobacterium sp. TaxID=68766 RepID=UPI0026DDAE46|nr:precorrin-6A reductase [Fusobacterium sp.]MDO4691033.1 precorrin-6A reductase [Fusobacterium sp.]
MIWVIGGTKDSREFLEKFIKYNNDVIVSTATEYGAKLIENLAVKSSSEKMDKNAMLKFVDENSISKIIDTSHPYAFEVSKNAMEVADEKNIKYFRFERETVDLLAKKHSNFENINELLAYVEKLEGNILVTLGSNNVPLFKNLKNLNNIYFRILPKWDMVKRCEDNNILPKNIIAMQGPFSENMNIAMIDQLQIKYLITKKAGDTGGEKEKISACDKTDVEIIYLEKKELQYRNCYSNIDELIDALREIK